MIKYTISQSILVLIGLFVSTIAFSQKTRITGVITDDRTNETLIGVSVSVDSLKIGVVTNLNGKYTIDVPPGKHTIKYSYLGYSIENKQINAVDGTTQEIDFKLKTEQKELKLVTVTGSQYEKDIAREVVSIDVIKKYLVENTNATDLAQAVAKVPGVSIVDGQASIRGGSGYAYGTGSRVQVLVDDIPLLSADLSEVRWNFVPIENMEQVEVIKGAASSMYGSGAMNGVIHVRTGYAYDKPQTKISIAQGIYSNPARSSLRWWSGYFNPFFTNAFLSHRQKFGNIDLVLGGNLNWNSGYIKDCSDQQARFNFKTRWRPKALKNWSFELAGNTMYQQFGQFFLWQDPDTAYVPWTGTVSYNKYAYFTLDPRITYMGAKGSVHKIRGRLYRINRINANEPIGKINGSSNILWGEYQYQKQFKFGLTITAGVVGSYSKSYSVLYPDTLQQIFYAGYTQLEKTFGTRWTLVGGARFERNRAFGLRNDKPKPVFRGGVNFQAARATFLRATWGQAYRFPSLGERYLDANLSSLSVIPNTSLRPEYGWTAELGLKQNFRVNNFLGYFDAAIFWSEFRDMIEYLLVVKPKFGFQAQNISKARVAGIELSTMADGKILGRPIRIYGGYTFNYPADLQSDTSQIKANIFMQNLFQSFKGVDSLQTSILKYRLRNMARGDIEIDVLDRLTVGGSVTYNSFMERIDAVFNGLNNIASYRKLHDKGIVTFDARVAFKISEKSTISLICKNIGNVEYSLRPGMLDAPRSFTLQYRLQF